MPVWPASLPPALADGYRETAADNIVRSSVDQGIAKLRRRSTAAPRHLSLVYLVSRAQLAALETFYRDTVSSGSLRFDFVHPRTGATVSCRFRQPFTAQAINGSYFRTAIELEILP